MAFKDEFLWLAGEIGVKLKDNLELNGGKGRIFVIGGWNIGEFE